MPDKPKQAKTTTIRELPPEWHEFKILAMNRGTTAVQMIRDFIVEMVKESKK